MEDLAFDMLKLKTTDNSLCDTNNLRVYLTDMFDEVLTLYQEFRNIHGEKR